jgi:uncharacterized membrane protein
MIQWCYRGLHRDDQLYPYQRCPPTESVFLHNPLQKKVERTMALRTQVLLIDDLDGSVADETITFGLDGRAYEIDLSNQNATQLRKALADYAAHARNASLNPATARRRVPAAPAVGNSSGVDTAGARAWARSNGYAVNNRGRISSEVLEAYRAAH